MKLSITVRRVVLGVLVVSLLFIPLLSLAQVTGAPETGTALTILITKIVNILVALLIAVAAIFIVVAAFGYLTAGGDDEKVKSAKQKLVYAVVAIVVALLAFALPKLVVNLLGLTPQVIPGT